MTRINPGAYKRRHAAFDLAHYKAGANNASRGILAELDADRFAVVIDMFNEAQARMTRMHDAQANTSGLIDDDAKLGAWAERVICPSCQGYKQPNDWLCFECATTGTDTTIKLPQ